MWPGYEASPNPSHNHGTHGGHEAITLGALILRETKISEGVADSTGITRAQYTGLHAVSSLQTPGAQGTSLLETSNSELP